MQCLHICAVLPTMHLHHCIIILCSFLLLNTNSIFLLSSIASLLQSFHLISFIIKNVKHFTTELGPFVSEQNTTGDCQFSIFLCHQSKTRYFRKQYVLLIISSGLNTTITQQTPRAYFTRKGRSVSPLRPSSPSASFG